MGRETKPSDRGRCFRWNLSYLRSDRIDLVELSLISLISHSHLRIHLPIVFIRLVGIRSAASPGWILHSFITLFSLHHFPSDTLSLSHTGQAGYRGRLVGWSAQTPKSLSEKFSKNVRSIFGSFSVPTAASPTTPPPLSSHSKVWAWF